MDKDGTLYEGRLRPGHIVLDLAQLSYWRHLKLLMGIMTFKLLTLLKFDDAGRRGHSKKLFKRRSRLDIRKYVFANRIAGK